MGRNKKTEETVRLNLRITRELREQLEDLKLRSEADSMTETVRRALKLYDTILEAQANGGTACVKRPDGSIVEIWVV